MGVVCRASSTIVLIVVVILVAGLRQQAREMSIIYSQFVSSTGFHDIGDRISSLEGGEGSDSTIKEDAEIETAEQSSPVIIFETNGGFTMSSVSDTESRNRNNGGTPSFPIHSLPLSLSLASQQQQQQQSPSKKIMSSARSRTHISSKTEGKLGTANQISWEKSSRAAKKQNREQFGSSRSRNKETAAAGKRRAETSRNIQNRIIYFLHLHKSGGTTMCRSAQKNLMTVSLKTNCNVQSNQRCCGGDDTIEAQQLFALTSPFSFVASEKPMYDAMDTEHYYYVVILRKAKARYISHYQHVKRGKLSPKMQGINFRSWWAHQPDNHNTRIICGSACNDVPKYQISREQFYQTVERLKKFESILFLEDFQNSYERFISSVGWRWKLDQPYQNQGSYKRDDGQFHFDPLMGALDDALYEYGQLLMAQQRTQKLSMTLSKETENMLDIYFSEGEKRLCSNECCGECSHYR